MRAAGHRNQNGEPECTAHFPKFARFAPSRDGEISNMWEGDPYPDIDTAPYRWAFSAV